MQQILLKSLPVANPGQLYRLGKEPDCCVSGGYDEGPEFSMVSYDLYKHLRDGTKGFEEMAAFQADIRCLQVIGRSNSICCTAGFTMGR